MKVSGSVLICLVIILSTVCGVHAEPIIGSGANTVQRNSFMFEGHFGYTSYTARYYLSQQQWIGFGEGESNTAMLILPQLHYGIFDFLSIRLSVPLIMNKVDYGTALSSSGIGDVYFDFKHRLYRGENGLPHVSWRAGGRFPTGSKDADVPLGDGSMDFLAEFLVTEEIPWCALHANIGYWYNGTVDSIDIDDQIFYAAAVEYPFGFQSALMIELNGFVSRSGEDQFYLLEVCPGMSNKTIQNLVLEASVKIPLKARGGLRYDFSPFVGCRYYF